MSTEEVAQETLGGMEILAPLVGSWHGEGLGDYPSIDAFRYSEILRFRTNGAEALFHYEQRTWQIAESPEDGEPLHWEAGFLRLVGDTRVEISNAQNGGRVEVLTGDVLCNAAGLTMTLTSTLLGHDDRMVRTRRTISVVHDRLRYVVEMATQSNPVLTQHLQAELHRQPE